MSISKTPKSAFSGRLEKAPDANRHPMEPPTATAPEAAATEPTHASPPPAKKPADKPVGKKPDEDLKPFTVRLQPGLVKRVKMACVERDVSQQDATAQALEDWLAKE